MSGSGFEYIIQVGFFIIAVWLAGRLMKFCKISPLLGQIAVGVLFGPNALDWVPYSTETYRYSFRVSVNSSTPSDVKVSHDLDPTPSILILAGQIGVILMILESGLHIDFETLKEVGARACLVAILGTLLPIVSGLGLALGLGYPLIPSMSIGISLAPTSVGIALNLLSARKQLDTVFGQVIVTAAFVDDVLSLVAFVVLMSLHKGSISVLTLTIPIVGSFAFVVAGVIVALKVAPVGARWIAKKISRDGTALEPRDEVVLILMFSILSIDAIIAEQIGSHLLGAFVAGITFSKVPRAGMIWKRQVKRIVHWLVRLFFSATVAFSIPVQSMFNLHAFIYGIIMTLIACSTKLLAGIALKEDRLLVGSAMVPRGEFAYLIAQRCFSSGLIDKTLFSILIWALVLATVLAPFGFEFTLARKMKNRVLSDYCAFQIQVSGHHHAGVLREICQLLHDEAFDVIQARMETDGQVDSEIFIVAPRGGKTVDIDPATLKHFEHHLKEVLDDPDAQVEVTPLTQKELFGIKGKLPSGGLQMKNNQPSSGILIKLMVDRNKDMFGLITQKLNEIDLFIKTSNLRTIGGKKEVDELYVVSKSGKPLDAMTREKIRDHLTTIFRQQDVKGEIMVRFVKDEPKHLQHVNPQLLRQVQSIPEDVYQITMRNPNISLDKIITKMGKLDLNVLSCNQASQGEHTEVQITVVDEFKGKQKWDGINKRRSTRRIATRSQSISTNLHSFFTTKTEQKCDNISRDICVSIVECNEQTLKYTCVDNHKHEFQKSLDDLDQTDVDEGSTSPPELPILSENKSFALQFDGSLGSPTQNCRISQQGGSEIRKVNSLSPTQSFDPRLSSPSKYTNTNLKPPSLKARTKSVHRLKFVSGKLSTDRVIGQHRRKISLGGDRDIPLQYV